MSSVNFKYYLSEEARRQHAAEHGVVLPFEQVSTLELAELPVETRRRFMMSLAKLSGGTVEVDLRSFPKLDSSRPGLSRAEEPAAWIVSERHAFGTVPSFEELIETASRFADVRAVLLVQAEVKAAEATRQRLEREEREAQLEEEGLRVVAQATMLAQDEEALRNLLAVMPTTVREAKVLVGLSYGSVAQRVRDLIEPFERARETEAKAKAEAERADWIKENGSTRLRRAFEAGYEVGRIYVIERAAKEASGWTVDFYGDAEWNERTNPSAEELDMADAATKLGLGEARLVWLTRPPKDSPEDAEDWAGETDDFEAGPALVIPGYQIKYSLVKEM